MKRKILLMGCISALLMGLVSCGQPASSEGTESVVNSSASETVPETEEKSNETSEESIGEDMPYWKGVRDLFVYDVYNLCGESIN